jgi:hypothetical protein
MYSLERVCWLLAVLFWPFLEFIFDGYGLVKLLSYLESDECGIDPSTISAITY